jgi:hypothetical protein
MLVENEQPGLAAPSSGDECPRALAGVKSIPSGYRKQGEEFRKQIAEALALARLARRYSENPETD